MLRKIFAFLAGLTTAIVSITLLQMLMFLLYPMPTAEAMNDPAELRKWVSELPSSANLLIAATYTLGSMLGGVAATKIMMGTAAGLHPTLMLGLTLTASAIVNFFVTMPGSPMWAAVLCIILQLPAALLGYRLARKTRV